MYKEKYLAAFIERLNTHQVVYTTPFLDLYLNDWFSEIGEMLREEITYNISLIPTKDDIQYLNIVLNKVMKNVIYIQNPLTLNKWIEKYYLSNYEFPFLKNKEVEQNLATSISQDNLDSDKKKIATNMQIDFFCYAAMIEAQKMIHYIDKLLIANNGFNEDIINSKSVKPILKTEIDKSTIFSSELSERLNTHTARLKVNEVLKSIKNFKSNLTDDPLLNENNEYVKIKKEFIEEYQLRTSHILSDDDLLLFDQDEQFTYWEKTKKEEIKKSFLKLIKELNQNNIFFFGCSFDNFKHNYENRLTTFLEHYLDASEYDFIEDELKFLENILYDIQNSEAAHDGHSQSGYDEFSKAYDFVSITGYQQYIYSHNKKIAFLNSKRTELTQRDKLNDVSTADNSIVKTEQVTNNIKVIGQSSLNDYTKSTIEDYLEEFKPDINGDGYNVLINALFEYFTKGTFPVLEGKIKFKRINKKRVGWALKELYKSEKTDNLKIEYFRFAQENINLFEKEVIVMENFNKSNFYKTFTSNPAK